MGLAQPGMGLSDQTVHGTDAAISYMEAHLHEKITADDVSRHCGLTVMS